MRANPLFKTLYRPTFATLGHNLTSRDGYPESAIAAAERRLGVRAPNALRDYYLVAGRERNFNKIHNRLLAPSDWSIDRGRLIFMEENQGVVVWATLACSTPAHDPPVFQSADGEPPFRWYKEHEKCSVFLSVMLHWQGVFGAAMQYADTARVSPRLVQKLRGWEFAGEVNKMRAFHRPGQAVCILKWDDWRVFAGAATKPGLSAIAEELGVAFEGSQPTERAEDSDASRQLEGDRRTLQSWFKNAQAGWCVLSFLIHPGLAKLALKEKALVGPSFLLNLPPHWTAKALPLVLACRNGKLFAFVSRVDRAAFESFQAERQEISPFAPAGATLEKFDVQFGPWRGKKYRYQQTGPPFWKRVDYNLAAGRRYVAVLLDGGGQNFDEARFESCLPSLGIVDSTT